MNGGRQRGVARELGIDECTLSWWLRKNSKQTKRTMKPVVIVEKEPGGAEVTMVLPNGIRIENLQLVGGDPREGAGMIGSGVRLPVYAYTRPCDLRHTFRERNAASGRKGPCGACGYQYDHAIRSSGPGGDGRCNP